MISVKALLSFNNVGVQVFSLCFLDGLSLDSHCLQRTRDKDTLGEGIVFVF